VKSIRTDSSIHAAEGDERIRTAEQGLGTSYTYEQFGAYLAGLTDGEGCFSIARNGPNAYKTEFIIHLRADDRPLLDWLRTTSGLGNVYIGRRNKQGTDQPSFRWAVTRRTECLELVALFEQYPLRSKKARDFRLWAQAVRAWHSSRWDLMRDCRLAIQATRAFSSEDAEFVVDDPQMAFPCEWPRPRPFHEHLDDDDFAVMEMEEQEDA